MHPRNQQSNLSVQNPSVHDTESLNRAAKQQSHAADLLRRQIDAIYHKDPNYLTTNQDEAIKPINTPQKSESPVQTHTQAQHQLHQASTQQNHHTTSTIHNQASHQIDNTTWSKYHSAWQSYYQQYYERYYATQVNNVKKMLQSQSSLNDNTMSEEEAINDLRSRLRHKIQKRAEKIRKSRHFIPAISGVIVMIAFVFLQYNRTFFAWAEAYVAPGNSSPGTLIVDPSVVYEVGPDPVLTIPKIRVENVPIRWDADSSSLESLNKAMDDGVAWFNMPGANAKPGQKGNLVISGHSSNDWLDSGKYKFIFARLDQLAEGDTIYVNYEGKRYTYAVTGSKVVKPTDVDALLIGTDKPRITLITCTPLGTALNRLLVFGDQVDPNPEEAEVVDESTDNNSESASMMPSNSPTFLQRIFGIRNN